jgi:hypothetical protein
VRGVGFRLIVNESAGAGGAGSEGSGAS